MFQIKQEAELRAARVVHFPGFSSFSSDSGNLDLIRAAAVLSVFFAHLHDIFSRSGSLLSWHFAQMGVLIFFVHTSMVLMLSLERTRLEVPALAGAFYVRRFFRIYPLAMFCVTAAMLLHRSPEPAVFMRHWTWREYFYNMSLTTNLTYTENMVGGLWTLPLEVQMYVTLPFLFLLGRSRSVALLFGAWLASMPIAVLQLHTTARLNVLGYVPCFIAGVIAWKLSLSARRRFPGWLWPLAFVITWPVFFLAKHENDMYFRWAFCLLLGLAIPWFQEISSRPLRVFAHVIAKYSYGIYLSHIAVILWTFRLPLSTTLKWIILVPVAAITPLAMYYIVEHPLIAVGKSLAAHVFRRHRSGCINDDSGAIRQPRPAEQSSLFVESQPLRTALRR